MVLYEMYFYRSRSGTTSPDVYLVYKSNNPDNYPIFNLKYNIEVNKSGSCTFIIGVTHPYYSIVEEINTFVAITVQYIKNGVVKHRYCPFLGRVIEISEDNMGNKEVTCEGALSTLNDSFERVGGWVGVIGAQEDKTIIYAVDAMRNIFNAHSRWHHAGYSDYAGIRNDNHNPDSLGVFNEIGVLDGDNIENVVIHPDLGEVISNYFNDSDSFKDDESYKNLYDMLFNTVLKKSGGFILPVYDPFYGNDYSIRDAICYWTYFASYRYNNYYSNYSTLVNYPNESLGSIAFDRTGWLPHFTKYYNVVNLSKESSLKTKFNMVLPVGKDNIGITGMSSGHPTLRVITMPNSPYEGFLPIVINFPDISDAETLESAAQGWVSLHSMDSSIPNKYTITGPEPCGVGCGEVLIMLMRDVIVREDPAEELINSLVLPCLSMSIDVQNPQNNVYVIGPFIDDTYTETTISEK